MIQSPVFFNKTEISKRLVMFLLFLYLVLYFFISTKILWIFYLILFVLLVFSRRKLVAKPVIVIAILGLPLVWGLIMSYDENLYNTVQGFFYLSIPLLLILIGYQLSKYFTIRQYFSNVLVIGIIISLFFIFVAIYRVGFKAFLSPYTTARFIIGSGSPACVLSLIISLYSDNFDLQLFKNKIRKYLSIMISLTAIYLFASRTYWVMLILFILIFGIKIMKNNRLLLVIFLLIGVFIISVNLINSEHSLSFSKSFIFKLTRSFKEISLSDFKTYKEINLNYRGYEAYMSWKSYIAGNFTELVFGHGLGKLVDLDARVFLAGKYWTSVPVLHNGFFYILVKTGALGTIFNLLFFFFFGLVGVRKYRSSDREQQFLAVFVLACAISLFMTNFVVCGMFNFEMSILLITSGFIISKQIIEVK